MLCCVCKAKEATVHLTQIVGEKMQKLDLCENCAKEKGISESSGFAVSDLMMGLGAAEEMAQAIGGSGQEVKCPRCGFTQADFKKSGRLGCAECYETFAEGLTSLLKTMQTGTRHVGKTPAGLQMSRTLNERIKLLQKKLDKAVAEEKFEKAAEYRDEIKRVKQKLAEAAGT